jgi:hypothetical protein
MRRERLFLYCFVIGTCFTAGCGSSAFPPPVTITFRDSYLGLGMVAVLTNDSAHHLYDVQVVGRNFRQLQNASVKATGHLEPHSTVEVGWLEFGSWVPIPGETIEVRCQDDFAPKIAIVPE